MNLTFYGGANEIGGNKILLQDKGAKIYLDFGESFDFGEDFFYEYLAPRTANGLEVYFEFGLVPKIPKLYSKDMLKLTNLKYEKPDIDAIFISHSHSDHVGHLPFVDEEIPIFIGHGTHKVIEAYHKLYPQLFSIGEHNNINLFKSGDKIKIKHLVIEPIHVEHSVPGAYGFIVQTSKGAIVYTGDLRMHGPMSEMTMEFIEKANKSNPIALLCEGTRMSHETEHNFTEKEVEERIDKIIKESKGLVLGYFSMVNIDRFMSFYNAAVKNKRILVIDTRLAYVIDNLKEKIKVLPDVRKDKNIRIYFRLSKSCTFSEKDYNIWEREYMDKMITYKEIAKNPKNYVMHLGFYRLIELVYLRPKNADFIYSSSEHFYEGEENEEQRKVWENWMSHFKIKFHKAHCSGHASKQDIIEIVRKINPKLLIPIHTQNAEEFKKFHSNVKIPEKGVELNV
ncbi:MBL fold metallo-hydrolase [Candidatus Woesearchaeota archaeon]|nr:MBL fold metallo-hydrolase [Candidatus Woesearchaeota archaeon]